MIAKIEMNLKKDINSQAFSAYKNEVGFGEDARKLLK